MPLLVLMTSRLTWVRLAALLFTCVAFSVVSHGGFVNGGMADWCIFCWAFSFAGTLLVLVVELMGLQSRAPVSWKNFPITFACYASLLCLSASIIFSLYFLNGEMRRDEVQDHRIVSSVFSCLATVAYFVEVSLTRAQPGEVAGYMATVPGLLKVCETFVASVIFLFVSDPASYDSHSALKWCMAVYCICFVISAAIVVMCIVECTGCLPFPFACFLSAYALLAVVMYLTAAVIWPVFKFDSHYSRSSSRPDDKLVAVLTALNFLIYLADLEYSAQLVSVKV
ncbi:myeloid-associated differentiation marker homolog [Sinocyclocheilus rhinocerous]|uniref:Myeloid-associated differentiation marker homolog n=1 Tax=Sinocyclocheilus rhinocerous TaxID=307959 RepID=A0A673H434_9TELE|nr:PREDICTED: myeloid-associated differentiation marker homolog [Sinocyclocheilus rhinocerous]